MQTPQAAVQQGEMELLQTGHHLRVHMILRWPWGWSDRCLGWQRAQCRARLIAECCSLFRSFKRGRTPLPSSLLPPRLVRLFAVCFDAACHTSLAMLIWLLFHPSLFRIAWQTVISAALPCTFAAVRVSQTTEYDARTIPVLAPTDTGDA